MDKNDRRDEKIGFENREEKTKRKALEGRGSMAYTHLVEAEERKRAHPAGGRLPPVARCHGVAQLPIAD
jgi:hypothetical protein